MQFDTRAIHCETDDPDVILISPPLGVNATLAHEVGHALTLVHTNNVVGLNTYTEIEPQVFVSNLMLQFGTNQMLSRPGRVFAAT